MQLYSYRISKLQRLNFHSLHRLQVLDLASNFISHIDFNFLQDLSRLKTFCLDNNPIGIYISF